MRRKIAVIAVSAMLAGSLAGCGQADAKEMSNVEVIKEQSVETTIVQSGDLDRSLSYNGMLSPKNMVRLVSTVPGEITELSVQIGDTVNKDDSIYTLDKVNVDRAVKNAKLSLEAAEHQVDSMVDQNALAVKSFERMKALYENPNGAAISQAQYEQAELGASTAGVDSAKVQLSKAKIALEQAITQQEDADLKTPISGIVSSLNIEVGQSVGGGQLIADVINMDEVYVDIQVAENVIGSLNPGDVIQGRIPAVSSEIIEGRVEWVSPSANLQTRLFPVRVIFDNADHKIKPGMFVDVKINIEEASDSIIIPSTSILDRTDGKIVYINQDGVAAERYVITEFDNGEFTVIQEGLNIDDELVVEGQQFIEVGTPLKVNGGE